MTAGGVRAEEKLQMVSEMPELLLMTFFCLVNCHGRIGGAWKIATALKMDPKFAQPQSNLGSVCGDWGSD